MRFNYRNHCMGCVPAHLGAGLSRGRKVELPHSQGIGQVWGWVGTCSCDGPYSCIIHYFCNKICSKIPRGTIKLNPCTAACRPALAPAFPRGGKWSFRTLRGLARRWGWKMRARVSVNIMHNNLIHVDLWNSCASVNFEPVHDRTPACLRAGPSWGRKVDPLHSWGLGRCGGWRGAIYVPVNYHPIQLAIQHQQCQ